MKSDAADGQSPLIRSLCVGGAMWSDVVFNYPAWIVGKRASAGLKPMPDKLQHLYKGGGVMWLSLGPTCMIEDYATTFFGQYTDSKLLASAGSGVIAASLVTSQVEYVICQAHAKNQASTLIAARTILKQNGLFYLLNPPGLVATCFREIPFAATLFYIHPLIREHWEARYPQDPQEYSVVSKIIAEFSCGVAAAAVSCPISQAPMTVAAYQQAESLSLMPAIRQIYSQGGVQAFFRGLVPRMVSLAGTFTVVPVVLDCLVDATQDY